MLKAQLSDGPQGMVPEDNKSKDGHLESHHLARSPSKGRSLSDGNDQVLSPSPKFREPEKRSKDDTSIDDPTTPRRPAFTLRGLSLQMPPRDLMSPEAVHDRVPLAPKVDHSTSYGSPASVPRRSRGLDFSRAATNLHHSTLAEQSSPDSSPTITGRAMNIPHRRGGQLFGNMDYHSSSSASLWTSIGNTDRTIVSSSLGSVNMLGSESSDTSSADEDLMDADEVDESILLTPQAYIGSGPFGLGVQASPGGAWMTTQSAAVSSLVNFQRTRMRHEKNRKTSSSSSRSSMASPKSKSPPPIRSIEGMTGGTQSRRESISWAANQLHISGSESDDGKLKSTLENADNLPVTPGRDGQRGVIRRVVTRRGNMLPKPKGFARIRAALAEESAPIETEVRREADVVRQVRESDGGLESSIPPSLQASATALSSPILGPTQESLGDIPEDDIMADSSSTPSTDRGLSSSFKQQAMRNSKGKKFWETFTEDRLQTPPPGLIPRASSSGISDDIPMDSPSLSTTSSSLYGPGFIFPTNELQDCQIRPPSPSLTAAPQAAPLLTAADITRRVNNKRRRDDDFDPTSFKRRAVSPGMSVQNSPVMQSPLQRDLNPWGTRPSSNSGSSGGEKAGGGTGQGIETGGRVNGAKRIGLQGMVDTNDGLMKMSIE